MLVLTLLRRLLALLRRPAPEPDWDADVPPYRGERHLTYVWRGENEPPIGKIGDW